MSATTLRAQARDALRDALARRYPGDSFFALSPRPEEFADEFALAVERLECMAADDRAAAIDALSATWVEDGWLHTARASAPAGNGLPDDVARVLRAGLHLAKLDEPDSGTRDEAVIAEWVREGRALGILLGGGSNLVALTLHESDFEDFRRQNPPQSRTASIVKTATADGGPAVPFSRVLLFRCAGNPIVPQGVKAIGVTAPDTVPLPPCEGVRWANDLQSIRAWPWQVETDVGPSPPTLRYEALPTMALPAALRTFVPEAARAVGCDAAFVALPLLAMLAGCVGTTRTARLKRDWSEFPILWTGVIAPSGTRKTPAMKLAFSHLRRIQRRALDEHEAAVGEYEAALAQSGGNRGTSGGHAASGASRPPAARRHIINDTTSEALAPILRTNPRGLVLERDELAGWLLDLDRYATTRGGDATRWLSMWSGEPILVDRKGSGTIHVPHAAVSVTGTIQPEVFQRVFGSEFRENGLRARFLLAMPPRRPGIWTKHEVSEDTDRRLGRIVEALLALNHDVDADGNPRPVELPLTQEALEAFVMWHDAHERMLVDEHGDLAAALAKLRGYCGRLALLFELVDAADAGRQATDIGVTSVSRAVELVDWFGRETRRIYAILDGREDDADRETRMLVEWIAARGGSATPRDLTRGPQRYRGKPELAREALDRLAERGLGDWADVEGHGRPARELRLRTGRDAGDGDVITREEG